MTRIFFALLALAVVVACTGGDDPEPTPTQPPATATQAPATATQAPATATQTPAPATATPTPTPEPTPTATPSPAPATATPTPEAAPPTLSMRDFVVDASTTGQDLLDRLSEEENACIKAAFGDAVYELLRGTPLLAATGSDNSAAAPLFACLTEENVVLAGTAFLSAAAGGYGDESRVCITDLMLEHPNFIYERLGFEWTGEQRTEAHVIILAFYDCLTDAEKAVWLLRTFTAVDAVSPLTGADLIAQLPESEATCVRETLSGDAYAAMEAATPLLATALGADAANCLTIESAATFLVVATEASIGSLSSESAACIGGFVAARPTYVPIVASHLNDPSTLSPEDFVQTAEGGFELFECLNEDELAAINGLVETLGTY